MGNTKLFLAPMQGVTDHIFRTSLNDCFGGIDGMFTPFMRLEGGKLRRRDERELQHVLNEPCTVPQILPKNADETVLLATPIVEAGCRMIDINMSCPFVPVVKSGRGAALLANLQAMQEVLAAASQFPDVQFSLKVRLGVKNFDEMEQFLPIINDSCVHQVTVHARTADMQYGGEASEEAFARFFDSCRKPVAYNGDVDSLDRANELADRYPGLYAVMIGRALVARPDLLIPQASADERLERIRQFYLNITQCHEQQLCGDAQWLAKMQDFWKLFLPDADRKLRKKILKTRKPDAMRAYAAQLLATPSLAFGEGGE